MSSMQFKMDDKFFEADLLIKENKIGEALQMLTEIITEMPDYGRAHNHLGWIYETKYNDYARAEKHYQAALSYSPEYVAIYYNYAILLSTLGRYDELIALLDRAMAIPGINKATIQNEYGIMYEAQGKYNEAIESYRNYIRFLYDNKLIDQAQESIRRCQNKMNLLNPGNNSNPGSGFKAP